jgi:transcriptional regulator MraZ
MWEGITSSSLKGQIMFRGINSINLDTKGRFAIPTKYRGPLSVEQKAELVVTIDTESPCLLLYPLAEWEFIEAKLQSLPSFNHAARRIQRLLIGHATDVEMDGNGRVLLPPVLREYAELNKKIVLIGQGKKLELWDEQKWNEVREHWLAEEAAGSEILPDEMKTLSL